MKKIIPIFFLFCCAGLLAQGKVAEKVSELRAGKSTFKHISVLTVTNPTPDAAIDKVVAGATFAKIKTEEVNDIVANQYETIEVEVPYQGQNIVTQLYKVDPFAEGFHADTDKATSIAYEKGVYYRGIIKDDMVSLVSMNFFQNEMNGVVSNNENNNVVIGKLEKEGNASDYIVYSDAKMKVLNQFNCAVKESAVHIEEPTADQSRSASDVMTTRWVTMYFEIDNNLYIENGSSTTTTLNWMSSVFNNVQTLYANDAITVSLKSTFIWTTQDPYAGLPVTAQSYDYLAKFNEVRPVFDGDVGQLVGIDPGGLGGVATSISGLCSSDNFSYADVNFDYSAVPTYSWTIEVVTHEMGHLLGSPHTHACVWNGNNTAIDNCAPFAIGEEGEGYECMTTPPTIPYTAKGTIMSYCHLVSGVGINLANGFGPQPKAAIIAAVNGGSCLSTDGVNTCINTVASISTSNATPTSMTISWVDLGSGSSWQIAVYAFSAVFPTYVTVTSPTYTKTELLPNTYYKIRVRPLCGGGMTPAYRQSIAATAADWCSGITITDTGGTTGNYQDMQSYTRTLMPNLPNRKITLAFSAFDLEPDYDYLYIYDGANTSATDLSAGGFTGATNPGTFASSSPDGAMTIRFYSDQGVVASGYVATIGCDENLGVANLQDIDFTYYPNPANGFVNIVSKTDITEILVYNPQGRLLYQSKNNGMEKKVDISAFATGTYFFKLKFGDKQANFKILKN
jgi:hypothetical protein